MTDTRQAGQGQETPVSLLTRLRRQAPEIVRSWLEEMAAGEERVLGSLGDSERLRPFGRALLDAIADFVDHGDCEKLRGELRDRAAVDLETGVDEEEHLERAIVAALDRLRSRVRAALRDAPEGSDPPISASDLNAVYRLEDGFSEAERLFAGAARGWSVAEARQRARLTGMLADMLAHELGNRLSAAHTAARLLISGHAPEDPDGLERLNGIVVSGIETGLHALDDVRALTTPVPDGTVALRSMALRRVVLDTIRRHRIEAEERGIEIRLDGALPETEVDAARVLLVLTNLLRNAICHHDPGRDPAWIRVCVSPASDRRGWDVEVADNGPGIEPDRLERSLRFRLLEAGLREGAGLGLPIARRAAEQMGSSLRVESEPGIGTRARFHVPEAGLADDSCRE